MSGKAKIGAGSKKNNNTAVVVIIALLVVLVIAMGAGMVVLLMKNGKNNDAAGNASTDAANPTREVAGSARFVLDESTAENVMEEMRKEVEEGMFECSMSTEWTFDDGNAESKDAYVANSTNNRHPFYFDVVLEDTEEVVYSSPVVPVGAQLTNFKLDKPLTAGKYKALCKYVLVQDEQNQEEISRANFVVTIEVRN